MRHNHIHLALVAGSAALALVACEARTPNAPYLPPAAPLDTSAEPVPIPAPPAPAPKVLTAAEKQMEDCIDVAPPRADGKASTLTAVRADDGRFAAVREVWSDGQATYAPGNPGIDTRANHLGFCVERANNATRPVELPTDEPIFKTQRLPQ